MCRECHRVKLVSDLETRLFAEIVNAGDIEQIIEREFVTAESCDFTEIARRNRAGRLASKFSFTLNFSLERFAQGSKRFLGNHISASSIFSNSSGFWFLNERSREIFSCNFIRPASNASGRGGQPEM